MSLHDRLRGVQVEDPEVGADTPRAGGSDVDGSARAVVNATRSVGRRSLAELSLPVAVVLWVGIVVVSTRQSPAAAVGCVVLGALGSWRGSSSSRGGRWSTVLLGVGALLWVTIAVRVSADTAVWLPAAAAAGWMAGAALAGVARPPASRVSSSGRMLAVVLAWTIAVVWTASGDPRATWWGAVEWHGPRSSDAVALTFDDGPNDSATLAIADILAGRGARGSFFVVGAAALARPDIVRELVARGQVVGTHSFRHGANDWLDPAYPEAVRGGKAVATVTGQCPTLFRPPHGRHDPLTSAAVARGGMHTVTWDVSGHDWDTTDATLVATRVLRGVRGGSIVLLHDGLDGDPTIDRTVVIRALPMILDGLAARGLRPVGLDELLGLTAWQSACTWDGE